MSADLPTRALEAPTAFDPFFRANFEKVARAAALIAGDLSSGHDLAQEAFLRLHERWDTMRSDDHARNFAYRVSVNLARSHLRKYRRLVPSGLRVTEPDRDAAPAAEDVSEVMAALASLPLRQRASVVLVDLAGMDSPSAARALGISANTVRVHVMRGREALRRALLTAVREASDES